MITKNVSQLKPGDIFYSRNKQKCRIVDKADYKKVFREEYPYGNWNSVLAYNMTTEDFTHFWPTDMVEIKPLIVKLHDLDPNDEFKFNNCLYVLVSKHYLTGGGSYDVGKYLVVDISEKSEFRIQHFDGTEMVEKCQTKQKN